jgi:hypothetical protein
MKILSGRALSILCVLIVPCVTQAKPIAFAHGTTAMAEYGAGTMKEVQAYYAPSFRYSVGGGHLSLRSELNAQEREITYARFNYLPKRWNMEDAQANVFAWGSLGHARTERDEGLFAWNVGGQFDYETRRVYSSIRTELHKSSAYEHRIDSLQLGLAPYKHDYGTYAVWFVAQARRYTGNIFDGTEYAGLIRIFKGNTWLEAGATREGKVQAMLMFNF